MTIIYRNDWNIKEKISYPLDFSKLDCKNMEYDPIGMFIEINDEALQAAICCLADEIATWNDWCYADNDNTKMKLFIPMPMSSREFDPSFQIEIQPPKWTLEEVDGTFLTEDMVYAAMDFHNGNDTMCETLQVYQTEFTADELKEISWIIISHLEDVIYKLEAEKRKAVAC